MRMLRNALRALSPRMEIAEGANHIEPAYDLPFAQQKPAPARVPSRAFELDFSRPRELVTSDHNDLITAPLLEYRYLDTDEHVLVPNVHNNQLPEYWLMCARARAQNKREEARAMEKNTYFSAKEREANVARLMKLADEIEAHAEQEDKALIASRNPQPGCQLPPSDSINMSRTRAAYEAYKAGKAERIRATDRANDIATLDQLDVEEGHARYALRVAFFLDTSDINSREICALVSPSAIGEIIARIDTRDREEINATEHHSERMR